MFEGEMFSGSPDDGPELFVLGLKAQNLTFNSLKLLAGAYKFSSVAEEFVFLSFNLQISCEPETHFPIWIRLEGF